jgi:hypothetical protein
MISYLVSNGIYLQGWIFPLYIVSVLLNFAYR